MLMQTSREDIRLSLTVTATVDGGSAEVEFVASPGRRKRRGLYGPPEQSAACPQRVRSILQALLFYASSVHHQKYHDVDIITVTVEGSR